MSSKTNHESQKARFYAAEVSKYLYSKAVVKQCNSYYYLKTAEAEAKRESAIAVIAGEATGAKKLGKRAIDQVSKIYCYMKTIRNDNDLLFIYYSYFKKTKQVIKEMLV